MRLSRRQTIALGAGAVGGLLAGSVRAQTLTGDTVPLEGGEAVIHPVQHASFVMSVPGVVVYADPVGGPELYAGLPGPGLILVTHEHPDHFDVPTLTALMAGGAPLLTNASVHGKLPPDLQANATAIAAGERTTANDIEIEAIPAYNTTPDRLQRHPRARGDCGYLLGIGGRRIYIAGDTEDTPEMRALTGIDVAFLPMNLPYTMSIEHAADAVAAFRPGIVYPYHYKGSDTAAFADLVAKSGAPTRVVLHDWYPSA
jgi:L-ascorbate metabolism protein UlaG (beta-lactamase superfamily)